MNDLPSILNALAPVIAATGAAVAGVIHAIRAGERKAQAAAETAVDEADAEHERELAELREQLRKLQGGAQ